MLVLAQWSADVQAQAPRLLTYQGLLTEMGTRVADGQRPVTFRIYAASEGGTALWTETQSVRTTNGTFSVVLGAGTPLNLPFDRPYFLGISVGTTVFGLIVSVMAMIFATTLKYRLVKTLSQVENEAFSLSTLIPEK